MRQFAARAIIVLCVWVTTSAQIAEVPEEVYSAIRNGDVKVLKAMLDRGMSPNTADSRGTSILMTSAAVGSIEGMRLLIARGADVNCRNKFGNTVLMWAVHDPVRVRLLLENGADVNRVTETAVRR